MGKFGFDDYEHDYDYDYEDDDSDYNYYEDDEELIYDEEETDLSEEADTGPVYEKYICEDCNHSWTVKASDEVDLYDYYNGRRQQGVCPMCGSFSVYADE